jgi:TolB protein
MLRRSLGPSLLISALVVASAQAAFPGKNGRIAFVSSGAASPEIATISPNGEGALLLTDDDAVDAAPAWSPTGERVAFESEGAIYTMAADGGDRKEIVPAGLLLQTDPTWSPNGRWIAFNSEGDIYKVPAEGGTPVPVTTGPQDDDDPAWSPKGNQIAFERSTQEDQRDDIFVAKPNGTNEGVKRISGAGPDEDDPSYSPDGKRILSHANRGRNPDDIYVMNADGSERRRLTTTARKDEESPAFSPDGKRVTFERQGVRKEAKDAIYTIRLNGAAITRVTPKGEDAGDPDWQPRPSG